MHISYGNQTILLFSLSLGACARVMVVVCVCVCYRASGYIPGLYVQSEVAYSFSFLPFL